MSNDGNTALPVSPVQEDEMFKFSAYLTRVANAIMRESDLAKQVEALSQQVQSLTTDLEHKTLHASELDQTIHELRGQRASLAEQFRASKQQVQDGAEMLARLHDAAQQDKAVINDLTQKLTEAQRDRDDHGLRAMQLEDEVAKAHSTLADFKHKLDVLFPPPKPEPTSEPKPADPAPTQAQPTEPSPDEPPKPEPENPNRYSW